MSPKLPRVTAKELLRALARDGWLPIRQRGSHVILDHPTKTGEVVVPNHPGKILKLKTISSVIEQAGLTTDDLRTLL